MPEPDAICDNCGEEIPADEVQQCEHCGIDGLGNCCIGVYDHDYCTWWDCDGYRKPPEPSTYWPGERDRELEDDDADD